MVWALIISVALFTGDIIEYEEVITDTDEPVEVIETDPDEPEPINVLVEVPEQDFVIYDDTGVVMLTSTEPVEETRSVIGTPYASVTSNAYSEIASRTIIKSGWNDDYVFWRSGQYEYCLAVGDIEFTGGVFSGDNCKLFRYTLDSGYNGTYRLSVENDSINLNVSNYIVYSNLGDYPVFDNTYVFGRIGIFIVMIVSACYVMNSMFSWVIRTGVYVWDMAKH